MTFGPWSLSFSSHFSLRGRRARRPPGWGGFCSFSAASEQPLGSPPTPVPTSRALGTMGSRAHKPSARTLSTIWWLEEPKGGTRKPPRVPDSPGEGFFVFHFACLLGSSPPRSWLGQAVPLTCLARPAHSLDVSPAGGPGGASYPLWG